MRYGIGIDPGLVESGLVLTTDAEQPEVVEWVTYSCPSAGEEDITRVISLAGAIVDCIIGWIDKHGIELLDVTIEMPVYTHNAHTFTKQIRLVEEIESGLFHLVTGEVRQFWMTEVYPSTSKGLLTNNGRAKKPEMIQFYEELTEQVWPEGTTLHTKETVADAYAHALSCWLVGSNMKLTRLNFTALTAAIVKERGRYGAIHR